MTSRWPVAVVALLLGASCEPTTRREPALYISPPGEYHVWIDIRYARPYERVEVGDHNVYLHIPPLILIDEHGVAQLGARWHFWYIETKVGSNHARPPTSELIKHGLVYEVADVPPEDGDPLGTWANWPECVWLEADGDVVACSPQFSRSGAWPRYAFHRFPSP